MFKKPVCPHCRAIYDRKEINEQRDKQIIKCHNCKKIFMVKKTSGFILMMFIALFVAILFNIFLLAVIKVTSVIPLVLFTLLFMLIAYLLRHLSVKYKK